MATTTNVRVCLVDAHKRHGKRKRRNRPRKPKRPGGVGVPRRCALPVAGLQTDLP
jgi:hypothetical protein